jgi:CRP/FNR family transcriptional regulator/CRP/FNR family cyclic AMP-dependent transcriptional regulator
MEATDLLRSIPLFASLESDALAELASRLTPRKYRRGETIFHKDDPGSALYIIENGNVKITSPSSEGGELILNIHTDGDFFGELSILDGAARSASAVAMEATQVLVLQRNEFLDVIHKKPDAAAEIMSILSYRLRRATSLLEDAVFLDLPARLAKRLLELADKHGVNTDEGLRIDLRLSQHELANSTGASRESVNRLLGQFQDRGLLRIDKQCFLIIDMDGLKEYIR